MILVSFFGSEIDNTRDSVVVVTNSLLGFVGTGFDVRVDTERSTDSSDILI